MSLHADAAVEYAAAGYAVLPIAAGEKRPPLVKGGYQAATRDPALIRSWWLKWPTANVATRTGGNLAVVEFDPRNGGSLDALRAYGLPLSTRALLSPSGGQHFHLRISRPVPSRANALGPGLDVKCDRGYVLLPPSVRADGAYQWLGAGLADPILDVDPDVLEVALGNQSGASGTPHATGRKRPEDVRLGEVHNTLLSWAGWLAWEGFTEAEAEDVLVQFVERIPAALDMTDTRDDIEKCLAWVYAKETIDDAD